MLGHVQGFYRRVKRDTSLCESGDAPTSGGGPAEARPPERRRHPSQMQPDVDELPLKLLKPRPGLLDLGIGATVIGQPPVRARLVVAG